MSGVGDRRLERRKRLFDGGDAGRLLARFEAILYHSLLEPRRRIRGLFLVEERLVLVRG